MEPTIHLTVTAAVRSAATDFAADLAAAVVATRARGPIEVPQDLLAALTPEAITPELIASLAEGMGLAVGGPPGPMAAVNTLLNAAPPRLREALLTGFLSLLQHP